MCIFLLGIIFDTSGLCDSYSMILGQFGSYTEKKKHINLIQWPELSKNMQFGAFLDMAKDEILIAYNKIFCMTV